MMDEAGSHNRAPADWKAEYDTHLHHLTLRRVRVSSILVVIVVSLDALFQFFAKPEVFYGIMWVRGMTILLILSLFGATYIHNIARHAITLAVVGTVIVLGDIEGAIIATGGYHSSFQTGLTLLVVAVGLLFPFSLRHIGIVALLAWSVFLIPIFLGQETVGNNDTMFVVNTFFLVCASIIAMTAVRLTSRLRRKEFYGRLALAEEQAKSERLLLNVLPAEIAERLKENHKVISDRIQEATVLFADIAGFTSFSASLLPDDLVKLLNNLFSRFDQLTERFGLEKIKTIGDSYMVAGGVPSGGELQAEAIADMALEMVKEMKRFREDTGVPLDIRIGINTGPIVAGVIGQKKFTYDLWGDTVNTASRMESHGLTGRIQVTEATYASLRDSHTFEERGLIDVRGKGQMKTYFLAGRKQGRDD